MKKTSDAYLTYLVCGVVLEGILLYVCYGITGGSGNFPLLAFFVTAVPIAYFTPTIVGFGKRNARAIFWLNLLLGWTFVGWVVALVWAYTKDSSTPPVTLVKVNQPLPASIFCSSCGKYSPVSNRFCGTCGASIPSASQ